MKRMRRWSARRPQPMSPTRRRSRLLNASLTLAQLQRIDMTATQSAELAQGKAQITALIKAKPEFGPIVLAHIQAKHGINSYPAFLAADLSDDAKLETILELSAGLVRLLSKQPHGLQGSVPGGQAHNPVVVIPVTAPERKPVTPQLPPPLPDTAYKLGTTTMAPAFGKRVTPSGDPPPMESPENKDRDGERPLSRRDSILPEVKPEIVPTGSTFDTPPKGTPPTDRLTEIIREIVGPVSGGLTAEDRREFREDVQEAVRQARLVLAQEFDAKLAALRNELLLADAQTVEAFKAHVAAFSLTPAESKQVA